MAGKGPVLTPHILLLTGLPGVGKTTVIRKVAASLAGRRVAGFYTKEIRVAGERQGFRAVTLDGRERDMARVDFRSPQRVGRYGVDVAVIDEIAKLTLIVDPAVDVYFVDEIGRMECLSSGFTAAMRDLLESAAPVVATIAQKGGGFVAEVKRRNDAELLQVTRGNRDELPARVLAWLAA